MKMIVTGSEGFIGKFLCQRLGERGVDVIGVDRKCGDEAAGIGELLKDGGVDCVFHLAAQTSVFNDNLEQIRKDNIDTFMAVADACRENNVKLVYASSSTANPCNTTSMYGISKRFDEQYARVYCPGATGVRLHNVYGPNPRRGTLLWHLLNEEEVTLYNNGGNIRCFTYIGDIVDSLIYAYGCDRQLINSANPENTAVRNFAEAVKAYNGVKLRYVDEKRPLDNFCQTVDEHLFLVPLDYTPVGIGLKLVFDER